MKLPTSRLTGILLPLLLAAAAAAQGVIERGHYIDEQLGFRIKIPDRWSQVPVQVDEKWIVAQFQSNREYEGHVKLDGDFTIHRPVMRVILFDQEVIKKIVTVQKDENSTVKTVKLPYRDYKDYVKRNLRDGGFYFSKESEGKVGSTRVTQYEVKVEKLTRDGRKQIMAYVFHGDDGLDFAVEFEFLMHHFDKLEKDGLRSLHTFKFVPRIGTRTTADDAGAGAETFGKWIRSDWKSKTVKERHDLRKQIEEIRINKAIAGLPEGWEVHKSKHFTVLSHASKKYTDRLVAAAESCWDWCEQRFGKLNDEYVSRGLIRICSSREEYQTYRSGSADAFSIDDKEIGAYEDKDYGNIGEWRGLFQAVYSHFMYDKDNLLYKDTPEWLTLGLFRYFSSARVKGTKIDFRIDEYEAEAFREMRRKDLPLMTPREMIHSTFESRSKDKKAGREPYYQLLTFIRFLEGPGKRHKLLKGKGFILGYLQAAVTAAEQYEKDHPSGTEKEAKTEAEEEERARAKDSRVSRRRAAILKAVNDRMCNWTDKEWESLDRAYQVFLKRLKFL